MKESYCIVDKRVTPCVEPSGYQKDKRGRTQFFCKCGVCGNKKVRYVKTKNELARLRRRAVIYLILSLEQQQNFLPNMLFLGWVTKQLKWDDMEQVS